MDKFNAIDLFSGAGGMSYGFHRHNFFIYLLPLMLSEENQVVVIPSSVTLHIARIWGLNLLR
jgi:hypothetical protein